MKRKRLTFRYARQSKSLIEQPNSWSRQIQEETDWYEKNYGAFNPCLPALSADTFCDINVSGTVPFALRPQGGLCLSILKPGDALIIQRPDRLGRDYWRDAGLIDRFINELKIQLLILIPTFGVCDLTTAHGKMIWAVMGIAAEMERDATSDRLKANVQYLKSQGRAYSTPATGTKHEERVCADGKTRKYVVRDDQWFQQCEVMEEWRAMGYSLKETAERANNSGFRRPGGQGYCKRRVSEALILFQSLRRSENAYKKEEADETGTD